MEKGCDDVTIIHMGKNQVMGIYMYDPDDLIALSALQHIVFCERQCALIHIEQVWSENLQTAEGRILHEKAHSDAEDVRGGVRIKYGMPLRSLRLGLVGVADVVEFHRDKTCPGGWRPFPVEYKRGRSKKLDCDRVQLCAQAMCLEEMMGLDVPCGALFYGKTRRREDVILDDTLREETRNAALKVHELILSGKTPGPVYKKRCESCSLIDTCMPKTMGKRRSVKSFMKRMVDDNEETS